MTPSAQLQPAGSRIRTSSIVTLGSTAIAAILTGITVGNFHAEGTFALLVFLPCLMAAGWFGLLMARRASNRAHQAMAATTVLLALATAVVYVPTWSGGGGCMAGLVLLSFIPISIGFPFVFLICWFLYGPNRGV